MNEPSAFALTIVGVVGIIATMALLIVHEYNVTDRDMAKAGLKQTNAISQGTSKTIWTK